MESEEDTEQDAGDVILFKENAPGIENDAERSNKIEIPD